MGVLDRIAPIGFESAKGTGADTSFLTEAGVTRATLVTLREGQKSGS